MTINNWLCRAGLYGTHPGASVVEFCCCCQVKSPGVKQSSCWRLFLRVCSVPQKVTTKVLLQNIILNLECLCVFCCKKPAELLYGRTWGQSETTRCLLLHSDELACKRTFLWLSDSEDAGWRCHVLLIFYCVLIFQGRKPLNPSMTITNIFWICLN